MTDHDDTVDAPGRRRDGRGRPVDRLVSHDSGHPPVLRRVRALATLAFLFAATPAAAQASITPSQTRLIGCFGEAFTLVEHVWRLAPRHLAHLIEQSKDAGTEGRKQFLDGFVSAAVLADHDSAFAVARNLNGCLDQASSAMAADQTTAILATAVRTELDSALEDVSDYIALVRRQQESLRAALRTDTSDARGSSLDSYLAFGERMRDQLSALRRKVDAVITAATPQ